MSKPMTPRERIDETFRHPYGCDCEVIDLEVAYQIADELSAALQRAEKADAEISRMDGIARERVAKLESELSRYREAEKTLPEEPEYCDADGYILQSNNQKPVFVKKAAYDALRAHAAALQAERDAMRGRLAKIMGCLGTVLRDNGFGDNDVAIIRSELTVAIKLSTIDAARGKK